jgi:2-phospho-L-lactate/phosphoenolpyruvate guanylyltransferase
VRAAVLVPVKDFRAAKKRLSGRLAPSERQELARRMAARVLAAAAPLPVFVVCDDSAVATWVDEHDATVLWRPAHGLNGAVTSGIEALAAEGFDRVVVAHSDLPLAHDLARFAIPPGVVIVPDRHHRGTNVMALPTQSVFQVAYGTGSFDRHREEAQRCGLPLSIEHDAALAWDVDTADDLNHPELKEFLAWLPTSPANPQ